MKNLSVIILAAGHGTRMKSQRPKILHAVAGKPMLHCILDQLKVLNPDKVVIVVGSRDAMQNFSHYRHIKCVLQKDKKGTAHAVMQTENEFRNYSGNILILNGDVPLITERTLKNLITQHKSSYAVLSILTAIVKNPFGYGRIIRKQNEVIRIVEELDADDHTKKIKEINAGTYCFKSSYLFKVLRSIKKNPHKGEFYLTDAIEILNHEGAKIHPMTIEDNDEILGVNTRFHLAQANMIMQRRLQKKLMDKGVTILDTNNTYIEYDVEIGQDSIIYPFTFLYGNTRIGKNASIGPFVQIYHTGIGDNARIFQSTIMESQLGDNIHIGPYAHIRDNSILKNDAQIGNFVEITRSNVGENTRAYHLSYIGDTEIGKKVNFGAGIITANFDGVRKNKTKIEDNVFIGSSTTIIAPAVVKKGEHIKSGSIIEGGKKGISRKKRK
ncbi:MAG: bifunctional UDP-N-acetylglucosamine diphosphorylase/glucosamine-1-phosphate N-acetyltransferase GlmU [Spirochaetes bacterium]|nr:bifunctional UDP-N-acetylglucosamine diphosphorylase/glucosamine-1-phosphate N-acetyltransferase GlmU [Spirochaetota bacterium]